MLNKLKGTGTAPARPSWIQIMNGLIGGILGIGVVAYMADAAELPLLMAPFGATCVLLFAAPQAPLAQPRSVIAGHVIAAAVGLVIMHLFGPGMVQMAVGVGVAIAAMQACHAVHAPAGANPLVILMGGVTDWSFLITPVLVGAVTLVLIALVVNNVGRGRAWPVYWY